MTIATQINATSPTNPGGQLMSPRRAALIAGIG